MAGEPFNPLVWLTDVVGDAVDWIHDTFSDPALSEEMRRDLGLDADDRLQGTPPTGEAIRLRHPDGSSVDVDKEAFLETVAAVRETYRRLRLFFGPLGLDAQTLGDVLFLLGEIGAAESIRVRWPLVHSIAKATGLVGGLVSREDVEGLDVVRSIDVLAGKSNVPSDTTEPGLLEGLRNVVGIGTAALIAAQPDLLPGQARASYGFEPDLPTTTPISDELARAAYTLDIADDPTGTSGVNGHVALTIVYLPPRGATPTRVHVGLGGGVSYTKGRLDLALEAPAATNFLFTTPWDWSNAKLGDVVTAVASYGRPEDRALEFGPQDGPHLVVDTIRLRLELSASSSVRLEFKGIDVSLAMGDADPFLASLSQELKSRFDLAVVYDENGLHFDGGPGRTSTETPRGAPLALLRPAAALARAAGGPSGGLEATVPPATTRYGPFRIHGGQFALGATTDGPAGTRLEISTTAAIDLGPFQATIDRIGLRADVRPGGADPNLGLVDLDVGFKPPTGIGLVIDAKAVRGGGFLSLDADKGEYAGVLELTFAGLSVKAIGIVNTKLAAPADWSLLLLLFAEFRQAPIQLGLGFNLTAVGGIIGLHHQASVDELRAALGTNIYDDVLFPAEPVKDAARIIGRLRSVFPVKANALAVGPTVEINWGTPPIVTARLGIIAQFAGALGGGDVRFTRLTILGTVRATAPPVTVDSPRLVQLTADVLGDYDVESGLIAIDARLRDSKIGGVEFSGSLIVRVGIGDVPAFAIAAGGFHPAFTDLPPALPGRIDRLGLQWKLGGSITLTLQAYAAVTASSWQLGAKFTLVAEIGPVDIDGALSFDAIAYDDGRFSVAIAGHVKIRWRGHTLTSVGIDMVLDRNANQVWHAAGSASFSVLWWDKEVDFETTWGDERSLPPAPTVDAGAKVRAALADRRSWVTQLPQGGEPLVTLAGAGSPSAAALAHPLGTLTVTQRVAPLGLRLDHLDGAPVAAGTTVDIDAVRVGGLSAPSTRRTTESFPRARFQDLSDRERLTAKTFESFPSGVEITPPGQSNPAGTVATFGFEPINLPPRDVKTIPPGTPITLPRNHLSWHTMLGRAASSPLRQRQRLGADDRTQHVSVAEPAVAVVDARDLHEAVVLSETEQRSAVLAAQRAGHGHRVVEVQEVGV